MDETLDPQHVDGVAKSNSEYKFRGIAIAQPPQQLGRAAFDVGFWPSHQSRHFASKGSRNSLQSWLHILGVEACPSSSTLGPFLCGSDLVGLLLAGWEYLQLDELLHGIVIG